ncbi:hypothetical protein SeMB42_g05586 [Synchytrium endobioticum]|uniref:MORN repeat-containing protein 5 n=1 Tax=Synchytrium endobioticum TaxID=286115 RepID=A0A507D6S3_9FUNG|nr:hypothetical protein SeMB42_g05586 [Synchytrium endobioticum]TPX47017.1 hypothetical protein SeLEV6574_g02870 [Synchytrium endobioticum]
MAFQCETTNGRIEGWGRHVLPSGNVYIGEFKDGRFDGRGTLHFTNGARYDAAWTHGVAVEGVLTFADGLVFQDAHWDYVTAGDRRFYSERVNGFKNGDPSLHLQSP